MSTPRSAPEIVTWDGHTLSRAIHDRTVSCVEVMAATLDQIDRVNPLANAIVSLRDRGELLAEAAERDADLAAGQSRGWMHGFPQAPKDLAATKDLRTTQGSPIFAETIPAADAIFVERMRAAGSIFVGKTNTPEFGLGSHTFNPVFGATRNPYDPERTAGGSSGGAAVALSLRMLPVADGSDHAGSLRNPAAFNNVLGLRPSYGRVPSAADEVFLPTLGVAGPMARTVQDLAWLLSVQAGDDRRLPFAIPEDGAMFRKPLERDLKGLRIGWLGDFNGYLPFEPGILDLCEAALRVFEDLGCIVERVSPGIHPQDVWTAWRTLRGWQVGAALNALYADPAKRDLMKPEARWEVEQGSAVTAFDVTRASTLRSQWYHEVCRLFERVDCLVLPSAQVFPFPVDTAWPREIAGRSMDTYHRWMEVVIPVTMSGCPALAVPVGFSKTGLPMGMQLWGPNRGEFGLLQIARAYEEATNWVARHPPALAEL